MPPSDSSEYGIEQAPFVFLSSSVLSHNLDLRSGTEQNLSFRRAACDEFSDVFGPIGGLLPMLRQKSADESLKAEANARAECGPCPFNTNIEGAPKEIGVIVQRPNCQTLFVRQHGR